MTWIDNKKDWVTPNKGQGPWAFTKSGQKYGYVNNPRFTYPATVKHEPCGYWLNGSYPVVTPVYSYEWYIQGVKFTGTVVTVGPGKDYETPHDAQVAYPSTDTLMLIYLGSYGASFCVPDGQNRYMKAMESDVSWGTNRQYSTNDKDYFVEGVTIAWDTIISGTTHFIFNKCTMQPNWHFLTVVSPNVNVKVLHCEGTLDFALYLQGDGTGVTIHKCVIGGGVSNGSYIENDSVTVPTAGYGIAYGSDIIRSKAIQTGTQITYATYDKYPLTLKGYHWNGI